MCGVGLIYSALSKTAKSRFQALKSAASVIPTAFAAG